MKIQKYKITTLLSGGFIATVLIIVLSLFINYSHYFYPFIKNIVLASSSYLIPNNYKKISNINFDQDTLIAQNDALQAEILLLKKQTEIDSTLTDYRPVNAAVISRNVTYWCDILTINRGSKDKIKEGMVVATNKGVVGIIKKVTEEYSQVELITNQAKNNYISILVKGKIGILDKYDKNTQTFKLTGFDKFNDFKKGDYVTTSGLGGVYPKGILIGVISDIGKINEFSQEIKLKTNEDLNNLSYVYVLKGKSYD